MPAKVYYDDDANLALLKDKTIAILGYGSQGHAQAQNLRDSGCNVIIGQRKGSPNYELAVSHNFKPLPLADATKQADIVNILLPDEVQGDLFRSEIKPYLDQVASHARFIPETARRLGDPLFTRTLDISQQSVIDFVERQEQLLQEVIEGLDKHSKAALALIFIRNGGLESPVKLRDSEISVLTKLGTDLGETIAALNALKGSLTVLVREESNMVWRFKHPTVGDAYASILLENPELMDIYIQGARPEQLLDAITCGDVGIEGAVVIPKSLYEFVEQKLNLFDNGAASQGWRRDWATQRKLDRFLAFRCDHAFLELYLSLHSAVLDRISRPGSRLDVVSEVDVTLRLFEFGLLPEEHRSKFVQTVIQYAIDGEDGYALESKRIKKMFTSSEKKDLKIRLRTELIPSLANARNNWEDNLPEDEDPESYIQPLEGLLSALEREFASDAGVIQTVQNEQFSIRRWVERAYQDIAERQGDRGFMEPDYDSGSYPRSEERIIGSERSIFEDVDL